MRLSSHEDDPGYLAWRALRDAGRAQAIVVLLNGIEQTHVEMADEERGIVRKCCLDERGGIFCIGDEIAKETLYGNVQIVLSDCKSGSEIGPISASHIRF